MADSQYLKKVMNDLSDMQVWSIGGIVGGEVGDFGVASLCLNDKDGEKARGTI
ncbi:Uu.00g134560.m01.CDS01 [Anthostomella pinea]|uniref:Uu.00g134560.m01.CDS01 n=1 Tax=Anthostomella pinea TaxID=933095 RepID=A0AAI8YIF0_9PEZI|nr:Uu.00g134560.m01.CDS01 [Anthostomella pinea]